MLLIYTSVKRPLLNQPSVLMDLFMINIAPTIFNFRFVFSVYSTLFFKLIQIIFSSGLYSWRYHRWCLAGTQPLACSVYCFLSFTFYVLVKNTHSPTIVVDPSVCILVELFLNILKYLQPKSCYPFDRLFACCTFSIYFQMIYTSV